MLEWEGSLAGRPNEPVLVRLTLSESTSVIRYDYVKVPRDVKAGVGLHLENGQLQFDRSYGSFAAGQPILSLEQGSGFSFGEDAGRPGFRLSCSRPPPGGIDIPMIAGGTTNPHLQLRYRIFSDCNEKSPAQCGVGDMRVGYRDLTDSNVVHPLTVTKSTRRRLSESGNIDSAVPDKVDVMLPPTLDGRDFTLVLEPDFGAVGTNQRFVFDLPSANLVTTVYKTEERVHRTYDSSEPPYYVDTKAGGTKFETKPVIDVTFNVPGIPVDRSPTQTAFTQAACGFASIPLQPLNSVIGAIGRGLETPTDSELIGTVPPGKSVTLSDFTARAMASATLRSAVANVP